MQDQGSNPSAATAVGKAFSKQVSAHSELHWIDDDGTATQVTSNGVVGGSGIKLPTGAVFFMVTGSCPTGSSDVTATYADRFVRINATGGTTAGADTHTHTGPSHTHAVSGTTSTTNGPDLMGGGGTPEPGNHAHTFSATSGAEGTGATGSTSNVPAYVTAKLCQVS